MRQDEKLTESIKIGLCLLAFFTGLFIFVARIGDAVYFGLACLSILSASIVFFRDQIKEINLKEMKMILQKTRSVREEINVVVRDLARIIATQSSYSSGSWVNRKQLNEDLTTLLATAETPGTEIDSMLGDARLMEKFMKDKDSLTEPEKARVDQIFSLVDPDSNTREHESGQ